MHIINIDSEEEKILISIFRKILLETLQTKIFRSQIRIIDENNKLKKRFFFFINTLKKYFTDKISQVI
jgi:hypothetical protein